MPKRGSKKEVWLHRTDHGVEVRLPKKVKVHVKVKSGKIEEIEEDVFQIERTEGPEGEPLKICTRGEPVERDERSKILRQTLGLFQEIVAILRLEELSPIRRVTEGKEKPKGKGRKRGPR